MKYFFSYYLLASFVLATFLAFWTFVYREREYLINRLVILCCAGSAIWSLGFGAMMIQTDTQMAYYCRSLGMIGVFVYLIAAQILVCRISGIGNGPRRLFEGFSLLGIIIYFMVIQPDVTVYELKRMCMTYYFKNGLFSTMYTAYSVLVGVNIFIVSLYMIKKSPLKRIQKFGRQFLVVLALIVAGMVLDTVFPMLGMNAIPGSSMTQFFGLIILWQAVHAISLSRINITNMSQYIYSSLAMPVLVYDAEGILHIMNDAGKRFFGRLRELPEKEKLGIDQLFCCEKQQIFSFEGNSHAVDTMCRYNDVACTLDISEICDTYGDKIGYIIIVTDQSERVRAMKRLEEARQEAELANKAKSRFLANMSHEIRTPMNAIMGFSELLLKEPLSEKSREYVRDIKSSSSNLLTTINDILDISKIESGKVEVVENNYRVSELLRDVGQIIRMQADEKSLTYDVKLGEDVPSELYGDDIRLRSILVNLLNNAVKYTEEGTICLQVQVRQRYQDMVVLEFQVADTGIGIAEEELGRLFERFSRVDIGRNYHVEGTGLGLAIVKNSVTIMGGQVTVDSTYGEGTVFTVSVPQKVMDAAPCRMGELDGNTQAENTDTPVFHGVSVLVVDDNPVNLKVICRSLESYGLTADAVGSGMDAINRCQVVNYPIVFMDQMMPQMDGVEAMTRIRQANSHYAPGAPGKIVALTANAINGVREELLREGFDDYLEKPMKFEELESVLLRFLPEECRGAGESTSANEETFVGTTEPKEQSDASAQNEILETELGKKLPGIDVAKGLSCCGGKIPDYLDILKTLYDNGESQLSALEQSFDEKKMELYGVRAHALKGGLLNIGADELGAAARELELAAKSADWELIQKKHGAFGASYRSFLSEVQALLQEYGLLQGISASVDAPETYRNLLSQLRDCVMNFDYPKAAETVRDMAKLAQNEARKQEVEQLKQWLDEMEEEKLLNRIEELLQ